MQPFYCKTIGAFLLSFSIYVAVTAQPAPVPKDDDLPKDYLSKDFHAGRRDALRKHHAR